jgi:pectin methylesterase-like acyl-CoA thioesterase
MSAFLKNYQFQILLVFFIGFVVFCVTAIRCQAESPNESDTLTVYPAVGSVNAYTDGELMITFNDPPVLNRATGFIEIYEKEKDVPTDTILFSNEIQETLGTSNNNINVGLQMTRVVGNSLYMTPHFGKLKYNTEYYIVIPSGAISANLNGAPFNGLSKEWAFKTRTAPNLTSPISVEGFQNSTADFRTVYGALEAIASKSGNWTINVAPGTYTELVHYAAGASNQSITINGTGNMDFGKDVLIQYTNGDKMNTGTHPRPSFYFSGANLVLKNITLKNTSTRAGGDPGQAEAIFFANGTGKTLAAYNCSFLSHQDTIQTSGKNWFYKCYIEGDTDYIWGRAEVCLLENCKLVSVNDPNKSEKQAILLVARTGSTDAATVGKGYVLINSEVTTENGMTTYLARNAGGSGFYDQCAVINTKFTGVIGAGLWRNSALFYLAGAAEHVGFKVYNNGGMFSTAGMPTGSTVMTDALFNDEYNSRDKILNRVYNKNGSYQAADFIWNITSLESTFGAN